MTGLLPITIAENGFNLTEIIVHHLGDAPLWHLDFNGLDVSITKRVVMMWIASALLLAIFLPIARKLTKNPYKKPSRFTGFFEVLINFVRHDVSQGAIGHHHKPYDGFLLTIFFFVLFCNLLGLIPPLGEIAHLISQWVGLAGAEPEGSHNIPFLVKLWPGITATGDISVTATLAVISFIIIQLSGLIYQGVGYVKNIVPSGIPAPLWIIMWPIEFFGQFTKPFALAIRLLANMTAGHLIILVFMGFIFQFQSYAVSPASVFGAVAINFLELFVAFLQAYIFTFLTALFIAGAQHRH